jgi:PAS domain S-box-containing protein
MEDALRESEQKFATAFRLGPAAMSILDLENGDRILDVNEGFEEATGYDRSDLLGRSVTELGLWPHPEECAAGEARFGMDARFRNLEFQFLRKTGEIRTGLISVEPMEINNRRCAITCTIDITDRKQAEAALLESEERFRNMADTAPVMIWVSGPDNLGTFFNKAWLDFTGRTMEEEVGEGWINGVHSDDLDYCLGACGASFEARRAFQLEFRLRRADGEYRWIVDTGAPRYRHGEFIGYIGSCLDVTDARRAQAESFARQKLESLGTLAAGIAHDFNNLLGGVLAQAELAAEELAAGSEPNEELKGIRDAAVRGSEIVRQLMIYAGKESDVLEPIDISSNVEEMLGLLKASVSKHATLVTDLDDDLPAVNARAAQIRQILMNLVVNASDAIRNRDGVIRVATDRVTVDRDIATALAEQLPEGDYVQLEVSDTGSGMSPETQARMFDPFFSTKSAGRGLGLAVIHGIVRSLQGAIRISSEVGKGSTFQVLLPSAGAPAGRTDTGAGVAEALPPSAKGTVLVVEDESSLRLAVSKILGKAGFTVFEADNGSKAIEVLCARGAEVDLLFLDMTLPGRPSDEVLAEALRTRRDMKVILTSAYSEEMVKQTLSAPQVRGFVRKPFRLGTVVEAVRSALLSEAT